MLLTTLLMINVKLLFTLAIVVIILVGCVTRFKGRNTPALPPPAYATVLVQEFQNFITDPDVDAQLVDVRSRDEFDEGHIAGALLIDVGEARFEERAKAVLDPQRPVAVYCRSGRRSAHAANLLALQGYNVTNLEGGVIAWQDAGKTLVK